MVAINCRVVFTIWLSSFVTASSAGLLSPVGSVLSGVVNLVNNTIPVSSINDANTCLARLGLSLEPSPDANLRTPQLIAKYGYPVETHTVTTEDGYILTLFRIPNGKSGVNLPYPTKPVAFLQHGLLSSSSDWLMNAENKSLAYKLAEAGYDVWLGNARGSDYSQGHVNLTINDFAYWNFSWHQMGQYDIPAVIDYILEVTGEEKIFYIGHSMGNTMFYVMTSLFPKYNDKIRVQVSLSPVAYLGNMLSPLGLLSPLQAEESLLFDIVGNGQFLPKSFLDGVGGFHSVGPLLCAPSPLALAVCGSAFFVIAGFDPCQLNTTQEVSNIVGHTPNSASSRSVIHYLQLKNSRQFEQFDYGVENLAQYGQLTPPKYNLSQISTKVAAYWALNDLLSVPADVAILLPQLPNLIKSKQVDFKLFNHLDFMYAIDINRLVYDDVLQTLANNY